MKRRYVIFLALVTAVVPIGIFSWNLRDTSKLEAERLATMLNWRPGSTVADIGAGAGEITIIAAERVGATGHVYATEIDPKKLEELRANVAKHQLTNVTVVRAGVADTNLPQNCCDTIFMRGVYHHLTQPIAIDTSIYRTLRPQGRLAIIDFPPNLFLSLFFPVKGVPKNRGGHGIPQPVLIHEVTSTGFQVVSIPHDWPGQNYCVLFQKRANGESKS